MWWINKNVAFYKPISFDSEFYYMANGLTLLIETWRNFQGSHDISAGNFSHVTWFQRGCEIEITLRRLLTSIQRCIDQEKQHHYNIVSTSCFKRCWNQVEIALQLRWNLVEIMMLKQISYEIFFQRRFNVSLLFFNVETMSLCLPGWMENSVFKIEWKLVENWMRNPRNSIILVDEFIVNLTRLYVRC